MIRGVELRGAIAINAISMIGIGPLITIPLVLASLHGALSLAGWVVGAVLALCDGLVWAELGSRYPGSGGTYGYLREIFGSKGLGKMLAFLFVWQTIFSAPLNLATGYIGFANYASYLFPALGEHHAWQAWVAVGVGVVTIVLLYRRIDGIARLGIAFGIVAVVTLLAVTAAAYGHFEPARAMSLDPAGSFGTGLLAGLGSALIITMYDYLGYNQASCVGDEVRSPATTLPRAIVISILAIAALYIALQVGILGAISWQELVPGVSGGQAPPAAAYVASTVVQRSWGTGPAWAMTIAILITAFASTFGNLLGYSRIPYAAAVDGVFLPAFRRLHPTGRFPDVSLLVIGVLALPACFFSLGDVINALTTGMVLIQSIAQIAALIVLRSRGTRAPYRMWLFPIPALIALVGWIVIFTAAGGVAIAYGITSLSLGLIVYLAWAWRRGAWPFALVTAMLLLLAVGWDSPANASANLGVARAAISLQAVPSSPTYSHSAVGQQNGYPVFTVDGNPFFVYGAAFFYERMPRSQWAASMRALKDLGINTLDLYVIWNWHELGDGRFDFTGQTSPRRDVRTLMQLTRRFGFKIILRPGPVIRNEWRNGGYPAWLLKQPPYGMPLHDLLEGRYPPTATLQNAHSDDAAAQWMANATHLHYSKRWIERALHEFAPVADLVIAVALDDDQGAYIDNQTWPAPHFAAYLDWLKGVVHGVTGPAMPVFINTYQMKVTASAPVWAWGNWYQSDAYAIGEHDRAQLEFSTGLLATQPQRPVMASEFQAGWLQQPDDVVPRTADPSNTDLALHTMLAMGAHGIVNFPAQDTLYPAGWEAPFANAFYAWDAAIGVGGSPSTRYRPTGKFGAVLRMLDQTSVAATHIAIDAGIAVLTSAYDEHRLTNRDIAEIAGRTIETQQLCRAHALSCALIDTRFDKLDPRRVPMLLVPTSRKLDVTLAIDRRWQQRIGRYLAAGGVAIAYPGPFAPARGPRSMTVGTNTLNAATIEALLALAHHRRFVAGAPGAILAVHDRTENPAFVILQNYDNAVRQFNAIELNVPGSTIRLPSIVVRPRSARLAAFHLSLARFDRGFRSRDEIAYTDCALGPAGLPSAVFRLWDDLPSTCRIDTRVNGRPHSARLELSFGSRVRIARDGAITSTGPGPWKQGYAAEVGLPLRSDARFPATQPTIRGPAGRANAFQWDVFEDGYPTVALQNDLVRIIISPSAGARAFVFEDLAHHTSIFTTVGALRDDVKIEPPLSMTDRIAKYTHQFPAGMFNRPYKVDVLETGARAVARFTYDAPDVVPAGARFERIVTLEPHARAFTVDETVEIRPSDSAATEQRAVSVTSLAVGNVRAMNTQTVLTPAAEAFAADTTLRIKTGNALGFYDRASHELASIVWRPTDIDDAQLLTRQHSVVARLTLNPSHAARTSYAYDFVLDLAAAERRLAERAEAVAR